MTSSTLTSTISILSMLITTHSIFSAAKPPPPPEFTGHIRNDSESLCRASNDYGNVVHKVPTGVLYPSSEKDIVDLIRASNRSPKPFTVAARGRGHSTRGQAMAGGGVVVDMTALGGGNRSRIRIKGSKEKGFYADVGGEQLWIDVLKAAAAKGVAPVSWTDYVYLSVGGTLSNAGISGQTFMHGPQIVNVVELDVITGKGKFTRCSRTRNPELFFGVLGGLGQFGIITRARIMLDVAPKRVKWAKLLYSNFTKFSRDQEYLISINASNYVEGFVYTNVKATAEWTSSSPSRRSEVVALLEKQGILYAIEVVKYYDDQTAASINQEFERLLNKLSYMPGFNYTRDVTFFDFINRVGILNYDSKYSHPWLHLFIPKSRILNFNVGVMAGMLPKLNNSNSVYLFYPMNRNKWDDRMSAVLPDDDEEVFYTIAMLHASRSDSYEAIDEFNNGVLDFCKREGMKVKQYLPEIGSKQGWEEQFGSKWGSFNRKKSMFDPNRILSPGQRIFSS